ncbi:MAG TPA: class I SAM-dependent methyltransferase, partial [Actinomycetota bacterium]|nr:class I SAM-dependent methyltransferase [Actinomycetota bacterium]
MESLTFDRAVEFYDKTRGLPDDVMEQVLALLTSRLRGGTCIEIGVGTGRFAIPLAEAGVEVTGIDLSEPMLRKLLERRQGTQPAVALAHALQLPFADGTFSSGLACHVFHLIPDWKDALAEMFRVISPGGVIAHDYGDFGHYEWRELLSEFLSAAGLP